MLQTILFKLKMLSIVIVLTTLLALNTQAQTPPLLFHNFESGTLGSMGWSVNPVSNFNQGFVTIGSHPASPAPTFNSGSRALIMRAAPGEGNILYGPVIQSGNEPVLMRLWMNVSDVGGNIAFGALNVPDGQNLASTDGGAGYSVKVNTSEFHGKYAVTFAMMKPQGNALAPIIQLVVPQIANQPAVTLTIDNIEIYSMNTALVSNPQLQGLLGINQSPFPTPTPIGGNPTPTPTVTPPPSNLDTIFINDVFTISPTDDINDAFDPVLIYDHQDEYALVSNIMTEGQFIDIGLHMQNVAEGTITNPVIINETFEETETKQPDMDVDFAGNRQIVWTDNRSAEKLFSIYYAPVDALDNKLVEGDFTVNREFVDTNTSDPAIATQDDSEMIVVWRDDRNFLNDIFARRLAWDGNSIFQIDEIDFQINKPFEDTHASTPDVAITPSDTILVVWSDNRVLQGNQKRNDIYGRLFNLSTPINSDDTLPNEVPEINISDFEDTLLDQSTLPQVAYSNGYYMVVWQSEIPSEGLTEIRGAVIDEQGQMVHTEFIVGGQEDGITLTNPSISAFPDNSGLFFISWFDVEKNEIFGTVYDPIDHTYIAIPIGLISEVFDLRQTTIAVGDNNQFILGWDGTFDQYLEIFTAPGEVAQSVAMNLIPVKQTSRKGFTTQAQPIEKPSIRTTSLKKPQRGDVEYSPKR